MMPSGKNLYRRTIGFTRFELVMIMVIMASMPGLAQSNSVPVESGSNAPVGSYQLARQRAEKIREDCIVNRRIICGKILKVLPGGLVVESGYTDLLRPALSRSWLVPAAVVAHRPANLIESTLPGSPCVGMVFLTNLPRVRGTGPRPKLYDYVVLLGYPTGQYTYTSVGIVQKTVRRFSADLGNAVSLDFATQEKSDSPAPQVK